MWFLLQNRRLQIGVFEVPIWVFKKAPRHKFWGVHFCYIFPWHFKNSAFQVFCQQRFLKVLLKNHGACEQVLRARLILKRPVVELNLTIAKIVEILVLFWYFWMSEFKIRCIYWHFWAWRGWKSYCFFLFCWDRELKKNAFTVISELEADGQFNYPTIVKILVAFLICLISSNCSLALGCSVPSMKFPMLS